MDLPEPIRTVAIVRALRGIGDFLCAVPAWRALRHALPGARITLIGLPEVARLAGRFHAYLDELLPFPGWPGIPEAPLEPARVVAFLSATQARRFDLALQMHGSGRFINDFVALLGARLSAGFFLPGDHCPDPARFLPYPDREHEIVRNLRVLEPLGIRGTSTALEFPVDDDDRAALAAVAGDLEPGRYAVVHPGAWAAARCWPAARFAAVGDALAAEGLEVVLSGTEEERATTSAVRRAMRARPRDLTGRLPLGPLAALLEGCRLVVCNDTGVSHLASALRTPSVVVFSASDPARWAPLDRARHRALGRPIQLAGHGESRAARPVVELDQALAAVRSLLREAHRGAA